MLIFWLSQEPQVELWAENTENSWSSDLATQLLDTTTHSTHLCPETFDIGIILQSRFIPFFLLISLSMRWQSPGMWNCPWPSWDMQGTLPFWFSLCILQYFFPPTLINPLYFTGILSFKTLKCLWFSHAIPDSPWSEVISVIMLLIMPFLWEFFHSLKLPCPLSLLLLDLK